jgi:CTP synthase
MKYVVVSGGVLSGLGKGVTASSIGVLLKSSGLKITSVKIYPFINSDAGTMSPFEHGEVFVLDDGGEVDLDLGNYERFLDINLGKNNNLTTGKVYSKVIESERRGDYLGKTVQVIPHITDAIQDWIEDVAHVSADGSGEVPDACIIELGGTVGDIESAPYIEALRQFQFRVGRENISFVHVSLVPVMGPVGEQKTKPTQHSVKELRGLGITPDILVCRSTSPMTQETKEKLAAFCHVSADAVMSTHDVPNIYHVPLMLEKQGLCKILNVDCNNTSLLSQWREMALNLDTLTEEVNIAMVGKYTDLSDAYLSVIKRLQHAAMAVSRKLNIDWIEASHLESSWKQQNSKEFDNAWKLLKSADGVLVPGGFGDRGIEGKILAAEYARTSKTPYLGICLGLQVATIEFCRNVLNLTGANSTEFEDNPEYPAVVFMPEISKTHLGGTMRLGLFEAKLRDKSLIRSIYKSQLINERHRHRYEVNINYKDQFEKKGMIFSGLSPDNKLPEIIELKNHPWFIGVQFHPEVKSKPFDPHPLFKSFIKASVDQSKVKNAE